MSRTRALQIISLILILLILHIVGIHPFFAKRKAKKLQNEARQALTRSMEDIMSDFFEGGKAPEGDHIASTREFNIMVAIRDAEEAAIKHNLSVTMSSKGNRILETMEPQTSPYNKPGAYNLEKLGMPLSKRTFTDKNGELRAIGVYHEPKCNSVITFTNTVLEGQEPKYVPLFDINNLK